MTFSIVVPILPFLRDIFHFSNIGFIEAIYIFLNTASLIFWGYVTDMVEKRRKLILLLGISGWTLSAIIVSAGFVTNISTYFLIRSLMALSSAVASPILYSLLGDIAEYQHRTWIASGISLALIIGNGGGILLSGIISEIDWKLSFLVLALLSLGTITVLIFYKFPPRGKAEPELVNIEFTTYRYHITAKDILKLIKIRTNLWLLLQGIFALIPSAILSYYLVSYLSDTKYHGLGIPLSIATLLALTIASGRIFGYIFFGWLADYMFQRRVNGRVYVATVSMFLQAPFMIAAFFIPLPYYTKNVFDVNYFITVNFLAFAILFFIGSFLGGAPAPTRRATLYDVNLPEHRGTMASLFSITDQIGATLGVFIGTLFITAYGYKTILGTSTFFYIIAGLIWLFSIHTVNPDQSYVRKVIQQRTNFFRKEGKKIFEV